MTFEPGREKPGIRGQKEPGRSSKKDPKQKSADLEARCKASGYDPWAAILEIAQNSDHPDHFQARKEILQYLFAKRKSVELSTDGDSEFRFVLMDYTSKAREENPEGICRADYTVPKKGY